MDNKTRHALKNDRFVTATKSGLEWAGENRRSVIVTVTLLLVIIVGAVGGYWLYNYRTGKADLAFAAAMTAYDAPLQNSGQPATPGVTTYASSADRARAANALFVSVANQYSLTTPGRNARYFAGLTYMDMGQTASAESTLKAVAGSWDRDLSALGKMALAAVYHQSGRDQQAIDLYNQVAAKPSETVSFGMAKLALAALYDSTGHADAAKKIYAELKDKDAKGAAGQIASEKLTDAVQVQN